MEGIIISIHAIPYSKPLKDVDSAMTMRNNGTIKDSTTMGKNLHEAAHQTMASLLRRSRSTVYSCALLRFPTHRLPLHPHLLPPPLPPHRLPLHPHLLPPPLPPHRLPLRHPLHGYTAGAPPAVGGGGGGRSDSAASGSSGSSASAHWAVFWAGIVALLSDFAFEVYDRHERKEKENILAFEKMEQETKGFISEGEFRNILVDEIRKVTTGIEKIANWISNGIGVEESGDAPAAKGPSDLAPPKEEKVEELPIPQELKVTKATAASPAEDRLFATPLARKLAEDHKVPLSSIKGTGPDGRIVKADIEDYLASGEKGVSKAAPKVDTAAAAS